MSEWQNAIRIKPFAVSGRVNAVNVALDGLSITEALAAVVWAAGALPNPIDLSAFSISLEDILEAILLRAPGKPEQKKKLTKMATNAGKEPGKRTAQTSKLYKVDPTEYLPLYR